MEYKHFSHHHTLTLYRIPAGQHQQQQHHFQCHGCHQPCRDSIYACWTCNFFLHEHCGNANRYVKHPSHASHPLVLMPTPTYCSGAFCCDACGANGNTFSYCCPLCEVDLHVNCAYLPPKVTSSSHQQHEVHLDFRGPDKNESCSICGKEVSNKNWSYFCDKPECRFRVHTFCATTEVKPGLCLYLDDEPEASDQVPTSTSSAGGTPEDVLAEMFKIQLALQMAQQLGQLG